MRVDITGRNVEITPALRQLIERRLARIERLLNDSAVSATVILTLEKYRHRTELIVHARGDHMLRGLGEGNGWTLSVRQATEKVQQQAKRLKGRWTERKRSVRARRTPARAAGAARPEDRDGGPRIIRATRYAVKPMSIEDAALGVEATANAFLVFRNAETFAVSILYRRQDGNLGLIEPE